MSRRKPGRHVDCVDCGNTFRTEDGGSVCPACVRLRRDSEIAEKRQAETAPDLPVAACREYASSVMAGETTAEDFGERLFWAAAEVRHRMEPAYPLPPRPAHLARTGLDDRLLLVVLANPHPYWLLLPNFVEPELW
jgi:hypothetical protein